MMKQRLSLVWVMAMVATLLLAGVMPASSQAVRYDVSSIEHVCLTDDGTNWQQGNVLHLRDVVHVNIDVSDYPELNGINTTYADADINLKNGNVTIRGTSSWQPDGIEGSWEGSWNFIANNGMFRAKAVAIGTGALSGKHLFIEIFDLPPDPDGQLFCDQVGGLYEGTELITGYVLETGSY
jgi:hypothetical protein